MQIQTIIELLVLVIVTEAITNIVVDGVIFDDIRNKIFSKGNFFSKLLSCGYCLSVWSAMLTATVCSFRIGFTIVDSYIINVFLIHRLSNILHEVIGRILKKEPFILSFGFFRQEQNEGTGPDKSTNSH